MSVDSTTFPIESSKAYQAILWGGLLAGVLDITAAFISVALQLGRGPIRVLQSIASGLLGAEAYKGGFTTAALGLVLHFVIAFGATTVYFLASRKLKFMAQQAVVCGILYGITVYFFMSWVVLPLSAVPFKGSFSPISLIIHILCVGLPIALVVRRHSE